MRILRPHRARGPEGATGEHASKACCLKGLIAALGAPPSRPLPLSQSGATPRAGARQRRRHAACFSLVRAVAALLLTVGSFQFRKPAKPTSRYAANKKPAAIVRTDTVPSQSVRRFPFPNRGIASSSFQSSCFVGDCTLAGRRGQQQIARPCRSLALSSKEGRAQPNGPRGPSRPQSRGLGTVSASAGEGGDGSTPRRSDVSSLPGSPILAFGEPRARR